MKKALILCLTILTIINCCSIVFALDDANAGNFVGSIAGNDINPLALWVCPVNSSHSGVRYEYINSSSHRICCYECNTTIRNSMSHTWSVSSPNCTTAKYCVYCDYHVPGGEATGHDVYPTSPSEYVAYSGTLHVHICKNSNCPSLEQNGGPGYLTDQPRGAHIFGVAYYDNYRNYLDGKWYHDKYKDCLYCDYTDYVDNICCSIQDERCPGGCD